MTRPPAFTADPKLSGITSAHAVILLEDLELLHLRSQDGVDGKDNLKRREGLFAAVIGGQQTLVRWATDKDGALTPATRANLRDRVLYVGPRRDPLELRVELIESDDKLDRDLGLTASVLGAAGGVAGVVPGAGTAVGAGLQLLARIFQQLRKIAADRKELASNTTLFFDDPPTPDQQLGWGTLELRHDRADNQGVAVRLRAKVLPLILTAEADPCPTQVFIESLRTHELPRRGELRVEYTFGAPPAARADTLSFALVDQAERSGELTSVKGKLLYDGPGVAGVPFRLTAAVVPRLDTSTLSDATGAASDLAGSGASVITAAMKDEEKKALVDTAVSALTKAALGATQVALDVIAHKADEKLLSLEGLLLPANAQLPGGPATIASLPGGDAPALITLGSPEQGVTLTVRVRKGR
jgi:hypothetical protein